MILVNDLKNAITQRATSYANHDNPLSSRQVVSIPLGKSLGKILAADITAPLDLPRQNLSAMDGFAFACGSQLDDGSTLSIVGESCAGTPFVGELSANQGVRIFTGAVVPQDCDTVVMQEHTNFEHIKDTLDKSQSYPITLNKSAKLGANIRHQGEEIRQGEPLLNCGKRLNPSDISLLASMGYDSVAVFAPLVVGIIATGDELVEIGKPLGSLAQIYNSNTPTLTALLSKLPITLKDYGITKDSLSATQDTIRRAISECDVIISSAGVSVGDYDFLTQVVDELGQINHYKVAMKPGKPFVFGEFGDHSQGKKRTVLYFGLPGNPLSTVVGCINFVRPALWHMLGATDAPLELCLNAHTTSPLHKNTGRREYQRAIFEQGANGLSVTPIGTQDSHRIKQLAHANCLLVLDEATTDVGAWEMVKIIPFDWVLC